MAWTENQRLLATLVLAGSLGLAVGAGIATETRQEEAIANVEVTPQACLNALDLANEAFSVASQALTASHDALQAVGRFDTVALAAATRKMNDLPDLPVGQYQAAVESCREQAE